MNSKAEHLISDLVERTKGVLNEAEGFNLLTQEKLNKKASSESWSNLECLEHLNRYGDFYIPEIDAKIKASRNKHESQFKSNWLGEYFSNMMLPKEGFKPMQTLKNMNPNGSNLDKTTLDKFIDQQKKILDLLDKARAVSLTKTKTGISISRFLKLRLGDTFRVVIYHNQRHIVQAKKALLI